jgi:hypothetical protein
LGGVQKRETTEKRKNRKTKQNRKKRTKREKEEEEREIGGQSMLMYAHTSLFTQREATSPAIRPHPGHDVKKKEGIYGTFYNQILALLRRHFTASCRKQGESHFTKFE